MSGNFFTESIVLNYDLYMRMNEFTFTSKAYLNRMSQKSVSAISDTFFHQKLFGIFSNLFDNSKFYLHLLTKIIFRI